MRTPTLQDITTARAIMNEAHDRPIGERLYELLLDIEPRCYNKAEIVVRDFVVNPTPAVTDKGKKTVYVFSKLSDTGKICPVPVDIDDLSPQFRWDMACQIWNKLRDNSDDEMCI